MTRGYAQQATWAEPHGIVDKVGMEGTGGLVRQSCGRHFPFVGLPLAALASSRGRLGSLASLVNCSAKSSRGVGARREPRVCSCGSRGSP